MNKVSLLAASVALALTGCGGSDSDSTTAPSGVMITGFDGYFNQAVVFDDRGNDGILSSGDPILGLTNSNGQIELAKNKFTSVNNIALQTLTPGGVVQKMLIERDPELFAGKYTIDMDHPTQAMDHEIVFRTLPGEKIISPLTDLVAIEAGPHPTDAKIEQAKKSVNLALDLPENSDVAFTDVIAKNDSKLHKTAQILTESKAAATKNNKQYFPVAIAKEATKVVKDNPNSVDDDNFKPVVDGDANTLPIINNKLIVNASVKEHMLVTLEPLEPHENINLTLPLVHEDKNLFADKDQDDGDIAIKATITTTTQEKITGVVLTAANDGDLIITGTPSLVRDTYIISLTANDIDSVDKAAGSTTTTFELKVKIENKAPVAGPEVKAELKTWFGELSLNQGMKVNATRQIDNLFTDPESDKLTYKAYSSVAGLVLDLVKNESTGITELKISGSPAHTYTAGETISISAYDGVSTVTERFLLVEIQGQSISIDSDEVKRTQKDITTTLGELKVGESVNDNSFSIVDLFDTTKVSGVTEYYAGLAFDLKVHEHKTNVPGVTVEVDENGTLSISGTPTKSTNDAYFLVAAGVNPDADDGVVSEMVRLALPNVQPKDDTGTPEPTPKLRFTQAHFEKGGVWKMGSFDNGDAEVAYASMRVIDNVNQLCFATDDNNPDNSLSNGLWHDALINLDNKTDDEIETDILASCEAVTLNQDGSISIPMENENETITISMFYQNVTKSSDYQIIIEATDPQSNSIDELFWLDSSETLFSSFTYPEAKDGYTEYMLLDDSGSYDKFNPLLSFFTYTEVKDIDDKETLRNGIYAAESITEPETWTGSWSVKELSPTRIGAKYLELPEFNDDVTRDIIRRHFTYRNFGDVNIGITDNDKDNAIDHDGVFYLTSDNEEIMTTIADAWTNK